MTSQFYDLNVEILKDGTIRLEQRDYCGESVNIDMHPIQAAFIAGGLPDNSVPERIATLERRMLWMRDRFEECRAALPSDIYERCAEAFEFSSWLQASIDVATEYCSDLTIKPQQIKVTDMAQHSGDESQLNKTGRNSEHPEHGNAELF